MDLNALTSAIAKTTRHATLTAENASVNEAGWDDFATKSVHTVITVKTAQSDAQKTCHRRQPVITSLVNSNVDLATLGSPVSIHAKRAHLEKTAKRSANATTAENVRTLTEFVTACQAGLVITARLRALTQHGATTVRTTANA